MNHAVPIDAQFFSDIRKPTSFYILRHGETTANAESRIQGRSEYSLNENGRLQALNLAMYLRNKDIRRLLHSPLARAAETAAIVGLGLGIGTPEVEPQLVELDTGVFTGLTFKEIQERYPAEYASFRYKSWEAVPDAESAEALYVRATAAWGRLKTAALESDGDVAAISHGGTIQWLVRVTFGCRLWNPLLTTGNCGIFELHVAPTGPGLPAYLQWRNFNLLPESETTSTPPVF